MNPTLRLVACYPHWNLCALQLQGHQLHCILCERPFLEFCNAVALFFKHGLMRTSGLQEKSGRRIRGSTSRGKWLEGRASGSSLGSAELWCVG